MLQMPVIGIEAEFKVFVDDVEVTPEEIWRTPSGFIERPLLKRTTKSLQLPTGGALYFDGGVLEVVTPVIEIAPQCTARAVRSLWEQIGFVRDQLDAWEKRSGKSARLQGFSTHFNIAFELPREERSRNRTVQKLALALVHLLPVPVIVIAANRRSSGVGVRPRRDRIEITFDFIPDPGLMAAATALIVGITRDVIARDSYRLDDLDVPMLAGLEPGRHETRKGWVARNFHFQRDPFRGDLDAEEWMTRDEEATSLRALALDVATQFRESIETLADPFSVELLFSVLDGETPALLDLDDRPAAYDDVGRSTRWGATIPELENFAALADDREKHRRSIDPAEKLAAPWRGESTDRRARTRRYPERRTTNAAAPSPKLTRSVYERVFLNLGNRKRVRMNGEMLTPVGVRGWYHSILRNAEGEERLVSIDQLIGGTVEWSKD